MYSSVEPSFVDYTGVTWGWSLGAWSYSPLLRGVSFGLLCVVMYLVLCSTVVFVRFRRVRRRMLGYIDLCLFHLSLGHLSAWISLLASPVLNMVLMLSSRGGSFLEDGSLHPVQESH